MIQQHKIALFGIQEQGLDIAQYLIDGGLKIDCFVTLDQESSIKNNASGWVDYTSYAKQEHIELYHCKNYALKHEDDIAFIKKSNFDVVLLGGWQRLISEEIINSVNYAIIGQHGSSEYLPRGRGRSPLNWSLIHNRKRLVWNLFKISPGIDDGAILDREICDINEWDDCKTLYYKVSIMVKQMMLRTIPRLLNGTLDTFEQIGEPTYYRKRTPSDGEINWQLSAYEIFNLVRAVTHPYPGAFTYVDNHQLKIWKAQVFDSKICYSTAKIGQVVEVFHSGEFLINCVDGLLLITEYEGHTPVKGDKCQ